MQFRLIVTWLGLLTISSATAQESAERQRPDYPPKMPGAHAEPYKTIGDVVLNAYIYFPEDHKPADRRPAIVFFFGGGWRIGSPQQFAPHCRYLASRGMVAISADYRVRERHGTLADSCVADAKSAIRWTRRQAQRLGVDPARVVAGGGSAGGHLAACAATISALDESGEDKAISSIPNALALFNPALVLVPVDGELPLRADQMATLPERTGVPAQQISPYHHVSPGVPPAIVFHGRGDETVTFRSAEQFTAAMQRAGNRCELVGYDEQPHGFFNYGRDDNVYFLATVRALDTFLQSLDYLEGQATIDDWMRLEDSRVENSSRNPK